jgi:hypothetical protein
MPSMDEAQQREVWHELFFLLSSSATVLIGLLFVVLTLHLREVAGSRDFRLRARNNTYHLLNVFIVTALALAPQPARWLGLEVAAVSLYGLRLPLGVTWHYCHQPADVRARNPFWTDVIVTIIVAYALGITAGVALVTGSGWGLPLVAASCGLLLVRTVLTAWALMFGLGSGPTTRDPT